MYSHTSATYIKIKQEGNCFVFFPSLVFYVNKISIKMGRTSAQSKASTKGSKPVSNTGPARLWNPDKLAVG